MTIYFFKLHFRSQLITFQKNGMYNCLYIPQGGVIFLDTLGYEVQMNIASFVHL